MNSINEYTELANDAVERTATAYEELNACIADYALAQDQLLTMNHLIEDKKNKMIAAGTIAGKNAEERAANAWIAIAEYDDLVVLESNAGTARANLEISKNKLSSARARLDYYMQMLSMLASNQMSTMKRDHGEEDFVS